jgi:hypothetical protein
MFTNFSPVGRMVIFFVALLLFCVKISNTSTRTVVSAMSVVVAVLIMCCIRITWRPTEDYEVWHESLVALRRTRNDLFKRVMELGQDVLSRLVTRPTPEDVHDIHSMTDQQSHIRGV